MPTSASTGSKQVKTAGAKAEPKADQEPKDKSAPGENPYLPDPEPPVGPPDVQPKTEDLLPSPPQNPPPNQPDPKDLVPSPPQGDVPDPADPNGNGVVQVTHENGRIEVIAAGEDGWQDRVREHQAKHGGVVDHKGDVKARTVKGVKAKDG